MPLFCSIAYFGLLGLVGYVVLCLVCGRRRLPLCEVVPLSGLLGAVAVPFVLFWLSLMGVQP
jgi:hypothetical protein